MLYGAMKALHAVLPPPLHTAICAFIRKGD
jgi:hypothetical protein